MEVTTKTEITESIIAILLPDAAPSRRRMLERAISSMDEAQLDDTAKAVAVGVREAKTSKIRDIVEARDLLSITYISKWGKMIDIGLLESELNQSFSHGDQMYDVYSPNFEAHVEAYMTYHTHCTACQPHDLDIDYSLLDETSPEPAQGHYVNYSQDYDLMEFVEKYPERVTELVRLAAERRGLSEKFVKEYFTADSSALAAGLL